jgi:hypothetical protein
VEVAVAVAVGVNVAVAVGVNVAVAVAVGVKVAVEVAVDVAVAVAVAVAVEVAVAVAVEVAVAVAVEVAVGVATTGLVAVAVAVGVAGTGVGVCGGTVGVAGGTVAVAVEVGVAMGVDAPVTMILPFVCPGSNDSRLSSIKMKSSGDGLQVKAVLADPLATLKGLSSNNVPDPASGTKLVMKAETRRILRVPGVGPGPGRIFDTILQSGLLVSPALCTGGAFTPLVAKPITAES